MTRPVVWWTAAVAAVAAVTTATATTVAADVTITRHPDGWVRAPAGTTSTLTVAAVSASGAHLTYRWQTAVVDTPAWAWTDVPGAPSAPTFTATQACTTRGNGPSVAADLRRYRVVVTGAAAAAGVASRESVWEPTLEAGTVIVAPPAVLWVPVGATPRLSWVVTRRLPAPGIGVVNAELHNRQSIPDRYKQEQGTATEGRPATTTLTLPSVTAADDGVRFVASYYATCGEDLYSSNTWSAVTTLRVHPRVCPAGLEAADADYGGAVLVAGDANHRHSCGDCAAACAATPLCDTWAYAADAGVPRRHRECWLKRRGGGAPFIKPPSPGGWVSGVLPAAGSCPSSTAAAVGADYDGEVLVRGDAAPLADCIACARACRGTPRCNVYVFGYDRGSRLAGECWLKRSATPWAPAVKPWTGAGESPWVSGVLRQTTYGAQ